jgi:putative inorganic carbon (HCO3(-)) transporter
VSALDETEAAAGRAIAQSRGLAARLARAEAWVVVPALLTGLASPRWLPAALIIAALFWPIRRAATGRFTARTPADRFVGVILLLLPVTLLVTPLPAVTRQQVEWLLAGIAVYYLVANRVRARSSERDLVRGLVAVGLFAALVAPFVVMWVTDIKLTFIPDAFYTALPLLAPVPMHPNVLAGALVLALPLPLALLLFHGEGMTRRQRAVALAAALGIAVILMLTKSRGAWLAAASAAILLSLFRWRRSWILVALLVAAGAFALWRVGLERAAAELIANGTIVGGPGRLEIWSRAVYVIQDFPLTGIGMGAFQQITNHLYPYFLLGPDADVPHAHNLFLQVAIDLGIFGLAAWLGLMTASLISARRVMLWGKSTGDSWSVGLGVGLLAAQLALLVHGVVDAAVWGAHSGIVVWLLWGVCAAAYNLRYWEGRALRDTPAVERH